MKFLLDTNLVIAAEPVSAGDVEARSSEAATFQRLVQEADHDYLVHPAGAQDIARDQDAARRAVRTIQLQRYPKLNDPPPIPDEWAALLGAPEPAGNDYVDLQMLAAVAGNAVHILVTEDRGLHRQARRVGLGDRVLTVREALTSLERLKGVATSLPPPVRHMKAHGLDGTDPIFDSLRDSYEDFDVWLAQAKREHRPCWVIDTDAGPYAAVCLVKEERERNDPGLPGPALKISTLKVAPDHQGRKYGELLLSAAFRHAADRDVDWLYVTTFAEEQPELVDLLRQFGFSAHERTIDRPRGKEQILVKPRAMTADDAGQLDPLDYHVRYGPPAVRPTPDQTFCVPIRPTYAERLFPGTGAQLPLFADDTSYGNAIKKAYLCRAPIRKVRPGATLLFYRSHDAQDVRVIGVVERTLVSADPAEVAAEVGNRTVYSMAEIEEMCSHGSVLAILFRHDRTMQQGLSLGDLLQARVLRGPPQSITQVQEEGWEWLRTRLQ